MIPEERPEGLSPIKLALMVNKTRSREINGEGCCNRQLLTFSSNDCIRDRFRESNDGSLGEKVDRDRYLPVMEIQEKVLGQAQSGVLPCYSAWRCNIQHDIRWFHGPHLSTVGVISAK